MVGDGGGGGGMQTFVWSFLDFWKLLRLVTFHPLFSKLHARNTHLICSLVVWTIYLYLIDLES